MEKLVLLLDGITVQHVGDLLDAQGESPEIARCARTYHQCLEDLSCAALFADEIFVSGSLPAYENGRAPGQDVVNALNKTEELVRSLPRTTITQPEMLNDPDYRAFITWDIQNLSRAIEDAPWRWEHLIIRDAQNHFGSDDSLRRENLPPERYNLAAPHYWFDPELQKLVPEEYVKELFPHVKATAAASRGSQGAIDTFIRRNALTHIGTFWMVDRAGNKLVPSNVRLPHTTRTQLSSLRSRSFFSKLDDTLLPMALCLVMRETNDKDRFLSQLILLRQWKPVQAIRGRLRDAIFEASKGHDDKVKDLRDDITNISIDLKTEMDQVSLNKDVTVDLGLADGPKAGLTFSPSELLERVAKGVVPKTRFGSRYFLRQFIQRASGGDCESALEAMFPALKKPAF